MKVKINSRTKTLAWDFDGTIIDSFRIVVEVVTEIAIAEGLPVPTDEEFLTNFHGTMRETLHLLLGGKFPEPEVDRLMSVFLSKQTRYYETVSEHMIEDALALVDRARAAGLTQILVTNREHADRGNASPRHLVANSVLDGAFKIIICGDEVEHRKPDPRVLAAYIKDHPFKADEFMIIGDQFVDGQLAMNLGCKAILVSRNGSEIAHLEKLGEGWEEHIAIVSSLHDVEL